jgi:uncharacterized radical SAM superfamily protein
MSKVKFVYPNKTVPISLTGEVCALNCPHCKGHYLRQMQDVSDPLGKIPKDAESYLISGGCDLEGAVPLKENLELLRGLSDSHRVIVHTGLIKEEDVSLISRFVYAASFNLVGDDSTIREVYNLDKTTDDFMESYKFLSERVNTYPHITIGLHHGKIKGEYKALDMLSQLNTKSVVFNVFIPTKGTDYENLKPPKLEDVKEVIGYAKRNMSAAELYLGCMRPGGLYRDELDSFCLKAEFERIVMPSHKIKQEARSNGYEITESQECCIV